MRASNRDSTVNSPVKGVVWLMRDLASSTIWAKFRLGAPWRLLRLFGGFAGRHFAPTGAVTWLRTS